MNLTFGEGHTENIAIMTATLLTKYYFGHSFPHGFKLRYFVVESDTS